MMKLSNLIVGLILVGTLFSGCYFLLDSFTGEDAYQITLTSKDKSYHVAFEKTSAAVDEINTQYNKTITAWQVDDSIFFVLVPDAFDLIKSTLKLPIAAFSEIVEASVSLFGLPPFMKSALLAIIVALFLFIFISLILRYET